MGKSKTQSSGVDNTTSGRQDQVWGSANALANQQLAPVNGAVGQALGNYQGVAHAGNLGIGALSGNPADVQQLMSPYQQQVIDQVNNQYGRGAAHITNSVNANAAAAGAFGGDRAAIAQGQGLSDLANQQALQVAGITNQGYGQAMNQAGQLANLGMGANGAAANIGQYLTQQGQAAQAHSFNTMQQAYGTAGNHGQTQTQSGSLLGDIAGIGSTVAGMFGGGGGGGNASQNGMTAINQSPYLNNLNTTTPNIP